MSRTPAIVAATMLVVLTGAAGVEGQLAPKPVAPRNAPAVAPNAARVAPNTALRTPLAAQRAIAAFRLDPVAIEQGTLKAVSDNRTESVTAANVSDKVAAGALFVSRVAPRGFDPPSSLRAALPANAGEQGVHLGFQLAARKEVSGQPVHFAAFVADGTGLVFDALQSAYAGTFYVGLSNVDDPSDRGRLEHPIEMRIAAEGATSLEPKPLSVDTLGSWVSAHVVVPNPQGSVYRITATADPQDRGDAVDLAISDPQIHLSAANPTIIGWGIGTTDIAIAVTGMLSPQLFSVRLHSEGGSIASSLVKFDASGMGTTTLRSDSGRSATIGIPSPTRVVSSPVNVTFRSPWLFLTTAVLGGLVGALLRKKARANSLRAVLIGIASGVVMSLAYAVGIDWVSKILPATHLAQSGEAVVFVLGVLGALAGVTAIVPAAAEGQPAE